MREELTDHHCYLEAACAGQRAGGLYTANLATVLGASAAFGFSLATFYLLPKYLKGELGADASEIGVVTGVFGAAVAAGAPLAGAWVDRVQRRLLITFGALVMAATSLAFLLVDSLGPAIIVLRAIQGVAFAGVFTAVGALVTDLAPEERLSEALGLSGASMLVMSAVAPPVVEPLARAGGWSAVFCVAAATALLGALLSLAVHERAGRRHLRAGGEVGLWALLKKRHTIHYAIVTAAAGAAFGVMFTFQQPFVMELGRDDVGGFFVAYAIVAIVVRLVFGSLPDRLGRFRVAVFSLNLYTVTVLSMAVLTPVWLELVGALLGLAHGVFFPAFNAAALARVDAGDRGKLLSVFTGAFYGGLAAGVFVLGVVADVAGYPPVFVLTAALTCCGGVLLLFSPELGGADTRG